MKKIVVFILVIIFIFSGCQELASDTGSPLSTKPVDTEIEELNRYQAQFMFLFDTHSQILGYEETEEIFGENANEIHAELEEYHKLYDIYNEYEGINNIATINKNAGIEPVKVDTKIMDMLDYSIAVYEETNGLTNIAMGSVLTIWHDYRSRGEDSPDTARLPKEEELEEAAKHMKMEDVIIDRENGTVFLKDPEMSLDVGSIGKGYAVEMVAQSMEAKGWDNYMLSIGGNIRVVGTKPDGKPWDAGIENPYGGENYPAVVELTSGSLVTSGSYQRFYTVDGENYHHIIHPETLKPEHYVTAVALLCEDSGQADALSTAVFNLPLEDGKKWVENHPDLEAMWMLEDESIVYSSGFTQHLRKDN